jgi:predicted AAA+ superfamily ATPase
MRKIDEIVLAHKNEEEKLLKEKYVKREIPQRAEELIKQDLIKIVIGPRRAGKSVFSVILLKDRDFAYLNFDDEELLKIKDYDEILKGLIQVYGEIDYILFDEIQNLDRWELFVNRLKRKGLNLTITGSNSKLLSKELTTHLTGRYLEIKILPFSFREFLDAKEFKIEKMDLISKEIQGRLLNLLTEYLENGGYPEVVVKGYGRDYLKTLFDGIIFKDIVKRYNVRYSSKLYELALYLTSTISKSTSYTRIKNSLNFRSVHTVENYMKYLEEAYLFVMLNRFSYKLKEQLKSPKKIYCIDTGMANAVGFKFTENTGRMMENLVTLELIRRGSEIYYWKNRFGEEVDFVVKEGYKIKQVIQVTYVSSKKELEEREMRALVKASKELKCRNLLVITWDYEGIEKYQNEKIKFLPLWKWLLDHDFY